MNEAKALGGLLVALLVAAYMSWTKEETKAEKKDVTIVDIKPEQLEGLTFYARTQTIAVSFKDVVGEKYAWFEIKTKRRTRSFVANTKFDDHLKKLAPFKAQRSLGKDLSKEELEQTKLDKPEKKLVLAYGGKKKAFEIGGRTSGSRDHYLSPESSTEVFLVESKTISDLEFPEGRFMQRKLRREKLDKVTKMVLSAEAGTKTALHKNRQSKSDEFWSDEAEPDTKSETLENYIDKLDKLVVIEYLTEPDKELEGATTVMEVTWFGEEDKSLGTTKILRKGEDKKSTYYATSPATKVPVKVSRFTADQLEQDLKTLFSK